MGPVWERGVWVAARRPRRYRRWGRTRSRSRRWGLLNCHRHQLQDHPGWGHDFCQSFANDASDLATRLQEFRQRRRLEWPTSSKR